MRYDILTDSFEFNLVANILKQIYAVCFVFTQANVVPAVISWTCVDGARRRHSSRGRNSSDESISRRGTRKASKKCLMNCRAVGENPSDEPQ